MKKIIGILLVGFLGLLGCSDGNDGTSPVGEAIPVAPYGLIHENPTYIWHSLQWATKYRIVVAGKYSTETPIIVEEYTAEEAGCESGDGLCMARPEATFSPSSDLQWMVRACANDECDYWSEPLEFKTSEDWGDPKPLVGGGGSRFRQNNDGTVYDKDTGLYWLWKIDKAAHNVHRAQCVNECERLRWEFIPIGEPGVRWFYSWRVPSSHELATLRYAVPKDPFTGKIDTAGFFDGKPFYQDIVPNYELRAWGPTFWSNTRYCSPGAYGRVTCEHYVWNFIPGAMWECWGREYPESSPGWEITCWCVAEKVIIPLGP